MAKRTKKVPRVRESIDRTRSERIRRPLDLGEKSDGRCTFGILAERNEVDID